MTCTNCDIEFPPGLVNDMCIQGSFQSVCGVCALAIMRKVHRNPAMEFSGGMALTMYRAAKAHLAKVELEKHQHVDIGGEGGGA